MYNYQELTDIIRSRIANNRPTSIVRIGDGEAMLLNGFNDVSALKKVLKRQLGYSPGIEDIEAIQQNLKQSYKDADIIGIPTERHLAKSDYWKKACEFGLSQGKPTTDIDFHNQFLANGVFDSMLSGIEHLCYISCRSLDEGLKNQYRIKNVWSFQIAPEAMFTSGYKGPLHYPDQFRAIERWMRKVPIKESICLVGAGFVGKIYNSWFKDLGGISIDIGNVFDAWAGKCTRGPNRGLDAVDNTYKL